MFSGFKQSCCGVRGEHRTSNLEHRTSNIERRTSNIQRSALPGSGSPYAVDICRFDEHRSSAADLRPGGAGSAHFFGVDNGEHTPEIFADRPADKKVIEMLPLGDLLSCPT